MAIPGVSIQTKLPANECVTLIVKSRGPRRGGLKTGVTLVSTTADPQPLAAVTPQDTTEAGDLGTVAWPSVRGLGLLCPSVPVERDHRPPITTQNPNSSPKAKSANPIITGTLQGACCLARGQRSTRRGTECQSAAYKHNGHCRLTGGLSTGARAQQGLQRISEVNLKHGRQTKDNLNAGLLRVLVS